MVIQMFYIRKGNKVFKFMDKFVGIPYWSEITSTTSSIVVCSFTTRADADKYRTTELSHVSDTEVVNHLDYIN